MLTLKIIGTQIVKAEFLKISMLHSINKAIICDIINVFYASYWSRL